MDSSVYVGDHLNRSNIRFVDVDGVRTRYYEDGTGEPLVLVHGGEYGFVAGLDDFSLNLDELSRYFHVFAVDKLGQGFTDNPKHADDYQFDATFRHFAGFLDKVGISRAHFAGHSRGGFLVAYLALEQPERVDRLVIIDSNTTAPENPEYPTNWFYEDLTRRMQPSPNSKQSVRFACAANSYSDAHITDDYLSRLLEIAQLPKTQVAQRAMAAQGGPRGGASLWLPSIFAKRKEAIRRIELTGLPVPTLIIWGANDPSAGLVPYCIPLYQCVMARTVCAELHVLNRAGHYSYREQPHAFHRVVRAFCLN